MFARKVSAGIHKRTLYIKCFINTSKQIVCYLLTSNHAEELQMEPAVGHYTLVEKSTYKGESQAEYYQSAQNSHTPSLFPKRD